VSGDIRSFVQIVRCKAAPVVMIPPRPNRRWGRGLLGLVVEEVEAALVLVSTLGIEIRVGGGGGRSFPQAMHDQRQVAAGVQGRGWLGIQLR
jgi:hypothetical protein